MSVIGAVSLDGSDQTPHTARKAVPIGFTDMGRDINTIGIINGGDNIGQMASFVIIGK